jgi:hypothetical protein
MSFGLQVVSNEPVLDGEYGISLAPVMPAETGSDEWLLMSQLHSHTPFLVKDFLENEIFKIHGALRISDCAKTLISFILFYYSFIEPSIGLLPLG